MSPDRFGSLILSLAMLLLNSCSPEAPNTSANTKSMGGSGSGGVSGTSTIAGLAGSSPGGNLGAGLAASGASSSGAGGNTTTGTGGRTSTTCVTATAGMSGSMSSAAGTGNDHWVGTWVSAQQLTEEGNKPPAPGLTGSTLRQVVHVSIGGSRLRIRFSNEYGTTPVTISSAHCANSAGGHTIDASTDQELTFSGASAVTIPAKQTVVSDPFDFALQPLSNLAISIAFGETSSDITGHPGSRTTSYLQAGNVVAEASLPNAGKTDHWYILSGIEVMADSETHAIVVLGDSIADGRGSTTNANDRWPDALSRRLQGNSSTTNVAVLNQGIGGNAVINGGLGPTAIQRFENDVLKQSGVRWLVLAEGVNDIGNADSNTAHNLVLFYEQFVTKAHAANILVYGVPILPFKGHSYYSAVHEVGRNTVNAWIRTPGNLDGVIDLDAAVRDPANPEMLLSSYDSGDHLHLNPVGYQRMADAIDLCLFVR